LNFEEANFDGLDDPFTKDEVNKAIDQMPRDKAPDPDGLTGVFFKNRWEIIKTNVMQVINIIGDLQVANLHWLNSANISLFPKKVTTEYISYFRPISLIHAIIIIAKILDVCLAPLVNDLVSNPQSAFIKKSSMHDNFLYVKNLAKRFQRSKTPALGLAPTKWGFPIPRGQGGGKTANLEWKIYHHRREHLSY
jgi:hypothetical protein